MILALSGVKAQNTLQGIAAEVCRELHKVDLADTSTPAMSRAAELLQIIVPRIDHRALVADYIRANPYAASLSQQQLEDRIATDIAVLLMRDCRPFTAIALNNGRLLPDLSPAALAHGERLGRLLDERLRNATMSQQLANAAIVETGADPVEMRAWLLTHHEPYQRWTVGNLIRQFRLLQSLGGAMGF